MSVSEYAAKMEAKASVWFCQACFRTEPQDVWIRVEVMDGLYDPDYYCSWECVVDGTTNIADQA